jgi:OmcA/MtrC family decaheme c-type cytochrome
MDLPSQAPEYQQYRGFSEYHSRFIEKECFFMNKFTFLLAFIVLLSVGIVLAQSNAEEGVVAEITDVTIGEDSIPVVTFTLADGAGDPLTLEQVESVRFLIARIDEDEDTGLPIYINYFTNEVKGDVFTLSGVVTDPAIEVVNQPTFEAGEGQFTEIATGQYTYTFGQALDDNYNDRLMHVVATEVIRGPRDNASNAIFKFVPSGRDAKLTNIIVNTESCNTCHGELNAHGGSRKSVEMCVMCHTSQNIDPDSGNSLDMKVLVHRIHSGANLPSVQDGNPYFIVGRGQSIIDFSTIQWSQDTRNCATCHGDETTDDFGDNASVAACTSCHDNVDPTISLNHPGSRKSPDSCSRCHFPELVEFDEESVPGIHVIPQYASTVKGVNFEIISVDNVIAGESPSITFKVSANDGTSISPSDMDYLAVTFAGPTTDYVNRVTEVIYRAPAEEPPAVENMGDGEVQYTLQAVIPEDSTGTYAFALEGYVMEDIEDVADPVRIAGFNPVAYVNVDGTEPDPRRQVVDRANCNNCHRDLALHGTIRQNVEYCVMCHNLNASDEDQRPEDAMPPTSISFPILVHRIHRGSDATSPLIVYGFNNSIHDYSNATFPRDITACQACHIPDTYNALPPSSQPITIMQGDELISQVFPARAVCTSCHDTSPADGHARLATTADGIETCAVCHGSERDFTVAKFHP